MKNLKWDDLVASEYNKLQVLVDLLKPFAEQTDLLQGDNNTLSYIIPAVIDLMYFLDEVRGVY